MSGIAGKDGRIHLGSVAYDEVGLPLDLGPSGGPAVGRVTRWQAWARQEPLDATTFGDDFRVWEGGLSAWEAELEAQWDAATEVCDQQELWACLLDDGFSGELSDDGRLSVTLFVDGAHIGERKAYYGACVVAKARVVVAREELVTARLRVVGIGALGYRSGAFGDGSYGAMACYACVELAGIDFAGMEMLAEK